VHVFLETPRLVLRRVTAADEDNLFRLNGDPEVMRYLGQGAPTSRDKIRDEIIPFQLDSYQRNAGLGLWAADGRGDGQFLGWFHLRPRRGDGVIDLGYRLVRRVWGQGLATEGSAALLAKAFGELGIDRVVAETMTANQASRRVLEKCGMTLVRTYPWSEPHPVEGAEQGCVEYELTRSQWLASRAGAATNDGGISGRPARGSGTWPR
jgi:RimJ/RimL family protein N-acetyltransferase